MTRVACPLAEQARRMPTGCAIWQDDRQISFAELHQRATALATHWRQAGMQPGEIVLFHPTTDWHDVVLLFALWRVGAMACPISHRLPAARHDDIAASLPADRCLDAQAVRQAVENAGSADDSGPQELEPLRPATVVLTSGTTGTPKAVVHSLAAHFASAGGSQTNIPLTVGDKWLSSLPIDHVGGLAIIFRTVLAGASLVVDRTRQSMAKKLSRLGITHVSLVSTQLRRLLAESVTPTGLQAVLLGGSSYPPTLIHDSLQKGLPLLTSYGLTEMASQVTTTSPGSPPYQLLTAGHVLPGRQTVIAADGEILVRGETLCLGYLGQRTITSVVDGAGWFHTGDVGWLDAEQLLHITGRRDQMFISGGENIHPEEIEVELLSLPGIVRAVVVPVADPEFGFRPAAFVQATAFDPQEWTQSLRARLPGFKVPRLFRPWPADVPAGVKPPRAWFRSLME